MGLYLLKQNEALLLEMNFEQILNFLTYAPKLLFSSPPEGSGTLMYLNLKGTSSKLGIDHRILIEYLETEFRESYETAERFSTAKVDIARREAKEKQLAAREQYKQQQQLKQLQSSQSTTTAEPTEEDKSDDQEEKKASEDNPAIEFEGTFEQI